MSKNVFLYGGIALAILIGTPTLALGGSFVSSLIQGKTPSEAVTIIGEQLDQLFGRVAMLEDQQAETDQSIAETQLEIERLRLENENLRLKADEALTGTAKIRADDARRTRCAELGAQLSAEEKAIREPFLSRSQPLQEEMRQLKLQRNQAASIDEGNQIKAQIDAKQKEIDAISIEMEEALEAMRTTPEMQSAIEELNALLCA